MHLSVCIVNMALAGLSSMHSICLGCACVLFVCLCACVCVYVCAYLYVCVCLCMYVRVRTLFQSFPAAATNFHACQRGSAPKSAADPNEIKCLQLYDVSYIGKKQKKTAREKINTPK